MHEVVGYIRVSTPRQAEEGCSLVEQAHMLRGYCEEKKLELVTIEEDGCSASGAQGHLVRLGLRTAIKIAKEKEAPILVPSVDRLARHPAILSEILEANIPVYSVADRRRLGNNALKQRLDRARHERDLISKRVRAGAAHAKANGVRLGNRTNLDIAQRNGAVANSVRADRKAQELADFIERTPGWDKMTLAAKVELLNQSGPLNLISEKRDERRSWTTSSIRKPLKRAETELDLRLEFETEEIVLASDWDSSQDDNDGAKNADARPASEDDPPVNIAYKDHPGFGKF